MSIASCQAFLYESSSKCLLQAVEKHLTEQYLTIIVLKKQMDTQYSPCLQKAEGVLPYIRMNFKRWSWEGGKSNDKICTKTEIHSVGQNNGRHLMKVKNLPTRGTI